MRDLKSLGWDALVIWECETWDAPGLEWRLRAFLRQPLSALCLCLADMAIFGRSFAAVSRLAARAAMAKDELGIAAS